MDEASEYFVKGETEWNPSPLKKRSPIKSFRKYEEVDWDIEIGSWISGIPYIWSIPKERPTTKEELKEDWLKCSRVYLLDYGKRDIDTFGLIDEYNHQFRKALLKNKCYGDELSVWKYFQITVINSPDERTKNYFLELLEDGSFHREIRINGEILGFDQSKLYYNEKTYGKIYENLYNFYKIDELFYPKRDEILSSILHNITDVSVEPNPLKMKSVITRYHGKDIRRSKSLAGRYPFSVFLEYFEDIRNLKGVDIPFLDSVSDKDFRDVTRLSKLSTLAIISDPQKKVYSMISERESNVLFDRIKSFIENIPEENASENEDHRLFFLLTYIPQKIDADVMEVFDNPAFLEEKDVKGIPREVFVIVDKNPTLLKNIPADDIERDQYGIYNIFIFDPDCFKRFDSSQLQDLRDVLLYKLGVMGDRNWGCVMVNRPKNLPAIKGAPPSARGIDFCKMWMYFLMDCMLRNSTTSYTECIKKCVKNLQNDTFEYKIFIRKYSGS